MALDRERRDRLLHEPQVCMIYFPCFSKYVKQINYDAEIDLILKQIWRWFIWRQVSFKARAITVHLYWIYTSHKCCTYFLKGNAMTFTQGYSSRSRSQYTHKQSCLDHNFSQATLILILLHAILTWPWPMVIHVISLRSRVACIIKYCALLDHGIS